MANINQIAQHHTTQTTAVIWARSTVNGVMSVVANGQTYTGDTLDTSVDDGCGVVELTGLSPDTAYEYTVYAGTTEIGSGELHTMPPTGSTFTLGFGTCAWFIIGPTPLLALIEKFPDLRGFGWLGDQVYTSMPEGGGSVTTYGETVRAVEYINPTDEAVSKDMIFKYYRAYWQQSGTRQILKRMANWFVGDDHDHNVGNDWDNTRIDTVNYFHTWTASLSEALDMNQWHDDCLRAYCKGNPNWPNFYFNVRINDDVELIFIDCVAYRDASDGTGTTIMGATQKQWFKDTLEQSTATFKIVMSNKNLWGGADDWSKYPTEQAEIVSFIGNMSGWAVPGGVIWCSGDIHYPYVSYLESACVNICSSPLATGYAVPGDGFGGNRIWKSNGYPSNATNGGKFKTAAYIRVHGSERLEFGLIDEQGNTRWSGNVYPGSNELVYDEKKVS